MKMKKSFHAWVMAAMMGSLCSVALPLYATESDHTISSVLTSATEQLKPLINLNDATVEELQLHLSGVGLAKAQNIVEYREKYGPFVSVNQLLEVPGIGNGLLERNRDKLGI